MKRRTCFEIPLHVSGLWKPYVTKSAISSGSWGAGILLRPGAICCPSRRVYPSFPHSKFFESRIECHLPVRVGVGYATSAIFSVASSLAERSVFTEAVAKAHSVEVLMKTGLGDVMAIAYGKGLAIRERPGGPGWGKVRSVKITSNVKIIGGIISSAWQDTPSMLSSIKSYRVFEKIWKEVLERRSLESFLEAAYKFSQELKMYPRELDYINTLEGVIGSYAKKSVLLTIIESDKVEDVYHILKNTAKNKIKNLKVFDVDRYGLRIINSG